MSINMQGPWTVSVKSKEAAFQQRFIISGAATGNGTYAGDVATPPVFVTGAAWTITIQNNPSGGFLDSADQITFPSLSAGQYHFDIQSNDAGPDQDFNDLILNCSTPATLEDYLVYGNVSYYAGRCIFNPCFLPWLVIDSAAALAAALKNPYLRVPIERLYPERVQIPPIPLPDPPPPFRPLLIPLREPTAIPTQVAQVFTVPTQTADAGRGKTGTATRNKGVEKTASSAGAPLRIASTEEALNPAASRPAELSSARAALDFDRVAVAGIVDRLFRICETGALPGVALRFQEYDRTNAELAGGPYTGGGDRENLGTCATDRNGNYVFRFQRSLADYLHEAFFDVAAGENVFTQVLPDVLVQLLDPAKPAGYCYESAPYWNIPFLKQINICVPKDCIGRLPTACQGSNAIQAVGNIFIGDPPAGPPPAGQPRGYGSRVGYNNFLGEDGRITAKNTLPDVPQARCAAWDGNLDFFACFIDQPSVKYYTIRYRKWGDVGPATWQFFQQLYKHPKIANLGLPNYSGDLVGPDASIPQLFVADSPNPNPQSVPTYNNIESDPAWVLTHRDRKAVINTNNLPFVPTPGPVQFWIEGYDSTGAKVAAAEDSITFYIDNTSPLYYIQEVDLMGAAVTPCSLITLPPGHESDPLTVLYKADEAQGFMKSYDLSVTRCSGGLSTDRKSGGAISGLYNHVDDLVCSQLQGTPDDPTANGSGVVTTVVGPVTGSQWLAAGQHFDIIFVSLACVTRVTNGYNTAEVSYPATSFSFGLQQ